MRRGAAVTYPKALPLGPARCTFQDVAPWPTEVLAVQPRMVGSYLRTQEQDGWVYTVWSRDKSRTLRLGHEWLVHE